MDISDGKQRDIWVHDWARDTLTQLTFDPGSDTESRLDARRQAHRIHVRPGQARRPRNLYWVNADGTGEVTRLTESPDEQ